MTSKHVTLKSGQLRSVPCQITGQRFLSLLRGFPLRLQLALELTNRAFEPFRGVLGGELRGALFHLGVRRYAGTLNHVCRLSEGQAAYSRISARRDRNMGAITAGDSSRATISFPR